MPKVKICAIIVSINKGGIMLEFLAVIVLVALFFGVSITVALYGTLAVFAIIIVMSILGTFCWPFVYAWWARLTDPKPKKKKRAGRFANIKTLKFDPSFMGWLLIFIITYLITAILVLVFNNLNTATTNALPWPIMLVVPALPFAALFVATTIKKRASSRS